MKFSAFWSFTLYLGVSTMLKAKRASCVRLERSKRGGKVFMCELKIFLMWHERASWGEKCIQFKWVSNGKVWLRWEKNQVNERG